MEAPGIAAKLRFTQMLRSFLARQTNTIKKIDLSVDC